MVFLVILYPFIITSNAQPDEPFDRWEMQDTPWQNIPEGDMWLKVVTTQDGDMVVEMRNKILYNWFTKNKERVVRIKMTSRCEENSDKSTAMTWLLKSTAAKMVDCAGEEKFIDIPRQFEDMFAPFPEEIERFLLEKFGPQERDLEV